MQWRGTSIRGVIEVAPPFDKRGVVDYLRKQASSEQLSFGSLLLNSSAIEA
jgi:hypothetical protein